MTHPDIMQSPPLVSVEYADDADAYGRVEIDALGCAQILRSFGVDDEHVESTLILVTGESQTREVLDPANQLLRNVAKDSTSRTIRKDGSGVVTVYMGSICTQDSYPPGLSASERLILGLSQRADLIKYGSDGIQAELRMAEKARGQGLRGKIAKLIGRDATSTAVLLPADERASQRQLDYIKDPKKAELLRVTAW